MSNYQEVQSTYNQIPSVVEQRNSQLFEKYSRHEETDNGVMPMHKEVNRLKTYNNWPCKFMEPKSLAKAGFYYVNKDDIVRCAFCHVEIGQWQRGDCAMADHKRWSNDCPFVRGLHYGNVPIEIDIAPRSSARQDTCGKYGIKIRPNSFPERETGRTSTNRVNLSKLGVQPNRGPAYAEYVTIERRLESFEGWPRSIKQRPEELAAAGFFYNGKGDQTICFHCGGGLKDWGDDDNPWEQHAQWFFKCNFVILQKGPENISDICSKQEALLTPDDTADRQVPSTSSLDISPINHHKTDSSSAPSASKVPLTKSKEIETKEHVSERGKISNINTLCKICYEAELGVVFLPCGHIVACVDCALALTKCAVCRKPLEATVRGFLQ